MVTIEDNLRDWVEHFITQSAIKHSDDAPYAGFGAMFSAQCGGQGVFVEHRRALVWYEGWRRSHEESNLRAAA